MSRRGLRTAAMLCGCIIKGDLPVPHGGFRNQCVPQDQLRELEGRSKDKCLPEGNTHSQIFILFCGVFFLISISFSSDTVLGSSENSCYVLGEFPRLLAFWMNNPKDNIQDQSGIQRSQTALGVTGTG